MDYNISINRNIIEIINLSKSFPGVLALDNVTFNIKEAEIHSVVGENGAGKSTLTKIIIGLLNKDSGRIIYNSKEVSYKNIHESLQDKISCVFQEFSLCPNLTVAENIFLGRSFNKFYNKLGLTIKDLKGKECEKHLKNIGIERLNVNELVGNLDVADKQLVEIAKSLVTEPRLLILDEPTSALSDNEAENLFELIRNFKKNGMTIILISHIIEDVVKISDSITVLRDGKHIITRLKKELTKDEIVRFMIGRKITKETLNEIKTEETIFKVNNLCTKKLKNISMTLKKGEILGVMGLQGSGSSEFLRSVYGIQLKSGEIILNGQKIKVRNPLEASQNGIIYIPADRKKEGLIESLNIGNNLSFMKLRNYNKLGFVIRKAMLNFAKKISKELNIKYGSLTNRIDSLSGGNQQKLVIGKYLGADPKILLMDDPTRGVDIGAKNEIYKIIKNIAESGKGIIFLSTELPELLMLCHRISVFYDGEIVAEFKKEEATEEEIMKWAVGIKES